MIIWLNLLNKKNTLKHKNKLRLYNILHISILHVYNESYIHNIGMATNMLAVSCLPAYRTIAWWAIPFPDQSAKLAIVYYFSHFIWQAVPDPGPIMNKWFKSIFRRVCHIVWLYILYIAHCFSLLQAHPCFRDLIDSHYSVWTMVSFMDAWPTEPNIQHFERYGNTS